MADNLHLVTIRLGHQSFALLLPQVENVIASSSERLERREPRATDPLWLSPHRLHYLSQRLPIVELSRRLGIAMVEPVESCEIVIARLGDGVRCALTVDAAKSVTNIGTAQISPLPRWLGDKGRLVWGSFLNADGEIVLLLDCERLFSAEERQVIKTH